MCPPRNVRMDAIAFFDQRKGPAHVAAHLAEFGGKGRPLRLRSSSSSSLVAGESGQAFAHARSNAS